MKQSMFTVSSLVHYLKQSLDQDMHIQGILIKGEIGNFTNHRSGHWYFTLKDAKARISCVMFASYAARCPLRLQEGMKVIVSASVSMYEAGGNLQLYVTRVQDDGLGDLYLRLEQLKQQLRQEGLFAPEHKKPLPAYPLRIGIVTAQSAAALQDMLTTIQRRWPLAEIRVYPALVQGKAAAADIVQRLQQADQGGHDVILLARGGGSIEDLWCFNEESVARCIYQMQTVIVTGIGHETDTTLADYVSDRRAPTPTAAAELITPDRKEVAQSLYERRQQLCRMMKNRLEQARMQLQPLREHRYLKQPLAYVQESQMKLAMHAKELSVIEHRVQTEKRELYQRQQQLAYAAQQIMAKKQQQLVKTKQVLCHGMEYYKNDIRKLYQQRVALLDAFSPLKILQRGYAIAYQHAHVVQHIAEIQLGASLEIRMQDGIVHADVSAKEEL